jgi:hypothetical protein
MAEPSTRDVVRGYHDGKIRDIKLVFDPTELNKLGGPPE